MSSSDIWLRLGNSIAALSAAIAASFVLGQPSVQAAPGNWSVDSPNGEVSVTVQLGGGSRQKWALHYRVEQGKAGARSIVMDDSALGLRLQGEDFARDLRFVSASPQKPVNDSYSLSHGKRLECRNRANELTLSFRNSRKQVLELDVRAYDNGVAFRYRLPGNGAGKLTLEEELTGFALPAGAKIWCAPSDKATTYSPGYETYFENEADAGKVAPLGLGWSFPMLYRTSDGRHWGLITEANLDGRFCGTRLSSGATNGAYQIAFPDPAEGNGAGHVKPSSSLPWEMPWRLILLGDSLAGIVESTLVTDVSAAGPAAPAWVRPGRVAWSWWSDQPSPRNAASQKKFVDLAAEMGWEYVLVDANWTIMENGNAREVLDYAKSKGVGVLLWYNSGGPHNIVTEKPRDCLTYEPVRKFELKMLQDWGVKGIKVDFFQSDKQDVIALYQDLLRDAPAFKIMLNFHGCTLPRGWERKYPHLMSMEAVRGEECYIFDSKYPDAAPVQNTILPFTRNAVGPMDYTPVAFSDNKYPHKTTVAHELALSVLFETAWLHFADKPESYLSLPAEPKQFLKSVPVVWDDTRFVDGYPGKFAVIARRKGNTWFLAGVNGQNKEMEANLQLGSWAGTGSREIQVIGDGNSAREFSSAPRTIDGQGRFRISMKPFGGFVGTVR